MCLGGLVQGASYIIPHTFGYVPHTCEYLQGIVSTQICSLAGLYCKLKLLHQLLYLVVKNRFLQWLVVKASIFLLYL